MNLKLTPLRGTIVPLIKVNHSILISSTIAMNVNLINEAVFYGELGYIVVPYYWKSNQLDLYLYNGDHQHFDFS